MGIYDREYYREEPAEGFELRGGWSMTVWLIVITAGVFIANLVTSSRGAESGWLMEMLQARPASLLKPYLWWQLVSYGFAHNTEDISHIFWNMFGLWIFGRAVEGIYGSKEFLRFYLVSIFLGGLFWTARMCALIATEPDAWEGIGELPWSLAGASGAVTAVTLLFCIHYPTQIIRLMLVLPVPAWFLGGLIIVGNILGALTGGSTIAFDVHLVGVVFAIFYFKLGWNLGRWTPRLSWPSALWSRRPRLRVHRPADEARDSFEDLSHRADKLLDKINREGIDSLTVSERRTLEEHSRRMRDRRG